VMQLLENAQVTVQHGRVLILFSDKFVPFNFPFVSL